MLEFDLNGKTPDIAEENIQKLRTIFPDVFTENKVDFEKLQQILGKHIETSNERYNFSWNGKAKALRIAQTPSTGTLRPCKEESKDWDTTQNLYIEGDNLEVLKLLQKSYQSKVKMIYIDPPYNTGNDFVYPDNFTDSIENYKAITGQVDAEGKNISSNKETSGRYHTDWLNMMYPRLRLARNLLTDDGVIFISIDDNEVDNLKKICNEVFGEDNFVGGFIKQSKVGGGSDTKFIVKEHEYCVLYARNISETQEMYVSHDTEYLHRYKEKDENGRYFWDTFARPGLKNPIIYDIIAPDGTIITNGWIRSKERYEKEYKEGTIRILKKSNDEWSVQFKQYLNINGKKPRSMTMDFGGSIDGKNDINNIFENDKLFGYPKSVKYLSSLFNTIKDNDIILDFFSGSSTTAHAVMQLNAEDGGNRKFIMAQLPEPTEEKNEAYKAGYKNICEIGKERIRRAGEKIKEEKGLQAQKLDIGFKVLKLDYSNIRRWQPDYNHLEESIADYIDNFMEGRTELDVVYEIMLKYGLDLTYPVDEYTIGDKKIYAIGYGMLIICLDNELTTDIANGILELVKQLEPKSTRVVFKDNGFKTDSNKTNIKEILKRGGIEEFITI